MKASGIMDFVDLLQVFGAGVSVGFVLAGTGLALLTWFHGRRRP